MEWNDEVIGRLRGLWAEGLSTAEIGRRLGVTKNAIVGKAHRLDLTARPSPIRRDPGAAPPRRAPARRMDGPTLPPLPSATCEPDQAFTVAEIPVEIAPHPVAAPLAVTAIEMAPPPAAIALPVAIAPPAATAPPAAIAPPVAFAPPVAPPPPAPVALTQIMPRPVPLTPPAPRPVLAQMRPAMVAPHPRPYAAAPKPYGRVVTCCWPLGEPGTRDFRFCDGPSEPGRPYCEDHVRVAYVRVRDRREDAA